jgi:thiol-disulfide isomerase/thioredoxin
VRWLSPVLAALALTLATGCGPSSDNGSKPSSSGTPSSSGNGGSTNATTSTGERAPDFSVTSLDGSTVRLADYAGKPVVLHFWATWCGPCRRELPIFDKIRGRYQSRGIVFLPIAVNDQRDKVKQYLQEQNLHFTSTLDPSGGSLSKYRSRYVPTTVTVDGKGIIVEKHIGAASEQDWSDMMEKLLSAGQD